MDHCQNRKFSTSLNKHFATLRTVVADCVRKLLLRPRDTVEDPLLAWTLVRVCLRLAQLIISKFSHITFSIGRASWE